MSELVTRRDRDGIATLTLNRPETLNALSPRLFQQLRAHLDAIAEQLESVGCVILRGEGRSFSSGNDLRAIQAGEAAPSPHFEAETLDAIEALPQPVIASVRGHCYTGALELALACSIVAHSWHTLRADKRLVNEGQRYALAEGLAFERRNSTGITPDTLVRLQEFGSKKGR